jgi:hypothetical protein
MLEKATFSVIVSIKILRYIISIQSVSLLSIHKSMQAKAYFVWYRRAMCNHYQNTAKVDCSGERLTCVRKSSGF